ncbi:MAG: low-specificity L-threonine aldolase [Kangiellaceae bacterium]|nr:low-specificity L-threonine aldolase [Kangiellaceae bacterium]MCW8998203.1 low-specificity L-threonine aldolase [Kangiellaceae bacterium]
MIDFRSDTVTRPCHAMRKAMANAEVGDDVYGDDPTVNGVQQKVADMFGTEAALLVPSGTQSNLIALLSHCQRGDEYIVGQEYHTYLYEAGGAATLGGIVPQPLPVEADGSLFLDKIQSSIKPDDVHFAKTRLLSLENTHNGKVVPPEYINSAIQLARDNQLLCHLDGARLFNAAIASGRSVPSLVKGFDSVSVCFSKGLGAPVGSMLCGNYNLIEQAKRWRKMLGGGMRQAGIVAAAIDFALENNIHRLKEDHENALLLAELLSEIGNIRVNPPQTNMVYIEFDSEVDTQKIARKLRQKNILISASRRTRLVTHLNISEQDIEKFVYELRQLMRIN